MDFQDKLDEIFTVKEHNQSDNYEEKMDNNSNVSNDELENQPNIKSPRPKKLKNGMGGLARKRNAGKSKDGKPFRDARKGSEKV